MSEVAHVRYAILGVLSLLTVFAWPCGLYRILETDVESPSDHGGSLDTPWARHLTLERGPLSTASVENAWRFREGVISEPLDVAARQRPHPVGAPPSGGVLAHDSHDSAATGARSRSLVEHFGLPGRHAGQPPQPPAGVSRGILVMNQGTLAQEGATITTPWRTKGGGARSLGSVSKELLRVLPPTDPFASLQFNTCALVGSSGILLEDELGAEIDAHQAVFRFDKAPTKGFEGHVGRRTTIRVVSRSHLGFRGSPSEVTLQHVTRESALRDFIAMRKKDPDAHVYAFDPSFYSTVLDPNLMQPTAGYFGLHVALTMCNRVDVYGFVKNWRGWMSYSYFNDEPPSASLQDRDEREWPLLLALMQMHSSRVRFMHACILDGDCEKCSRGARCLEGSPLPLPRVGYCRMKGTQCFFKCLPGYLVCFQGMTGVCAPLPKLGGQLLHSEECTPPFRI